MAILIKILNKKAFIYKNVHCRQNFDGTWETSVGEVYKTSSAMLKDIKNEL